MFTASPSLCQSRLFMFSVKFQGKFLWINTTLRKSKISLVMQNQENWRYMSFLVASVQTSPKGNDRITVGKRREDKWIQQAYFIWLTFSTKDDIFEKTKSASHFIPLFFIGWWLSQHISFNFNFTPQELKQSYNTLYQMDKRQSYLVNLITFPS